MKARSTLAQEQENTPEIDESERLTVWNVARHTDDQA